MLLDVLITSILKSNESHVEESECVKYVRLL